jgi:hypothetical protein
MWYQNINDHRKDATPETICGPGRLINHRKGIGRNLKPFTVEVDGLPRIFFMVDVDSIPPRRQVYYDYSDQRKSIIFGNEWLFINDADPSDDDEGKDVLIYILTQY